MVDRSQAGGSGLGLLYVTATYPFAEGEGFLAPEVRALAAAGTRLRIAPVRAWGARRAVPAGVTVDEGHLVDPRTLVLAVAHLATHPREAMILAKGLSASPRHLLKNLAVVARGVALGRAARGQELAAVHAHWLGTSGTMGWVASVVAGLPVSFTAHRWDIKEGNLLRLKADAGPIRVIARSSSEMLTQRIGAHPSVVVAHLGTELPGGPPVTQPPAGRLEAVALGNLIPVKGHEHLVRALSLLPREIEVHVDLFGEGPLRAELESLVHELGVSDRITLRGQVSHDAIVEALASGRYAAMVHPSVDLGGGEHEGIPVSLMEAMSVGIVPLATRTGGIAELVHDGENGLLVPGADAAALAAGLEQLAGDPSLRRRLAARAVETVSEEFDVEACAATLLDLVRGADMRAAHS